MSEWDKSSYCVEGDCVEVKRTPDYVAVRDSKDQARNPLVFTHDEWDAFVKGIQAGEFDGAA